MDDGTMSTASFENNLHLAPPLAPLPEPSPARPLRVLILEDNPRDARLTASEIEGGEFQLQIEVTDSRQVFRERLKNADYDIILSDYNLRNWDAMDALEILKQSGKDIPLIVVTGSLGDESAVECIKQGATDFVLKDRPARLPLAIQRALEDRKLREQHRLAEIENTRLAVIVNSSDDAIFSTTIEGIIATWNAGAERMLGYKAEEVRGKHFSILVPESHRAGLAENQERLLRGEAITHYEQERLRKDGSTIQVSLTLSSLKDSAGFVTGVAAIARDITQQKTLEAQLQQSGKMEAIGRMAGGVSHDFNNLLTIINGYSELSLEALGPGNPAIEYLTEIKRAGERAASLTRQLLAFSRRQVLAPEVLCLNAVVANVQKMLTRMIGEDVKLRTALDPSLGRVKADPGQVEQVLMNLAVNARDAMPSGGNLTIETSNVELDQAYARNHPAVNPGPHVLLAVHDTGMGMSEETKARIFEPFFTTKEKGKGTGLGLATVYGIVQQSGGSIWVESELARGTAFRIFLPAVSEGLSIKEQAKTGADSVAGTETIMVVEDEVSVHSLIRLALASAGYKVLEMHDGESALAACTKYDGPIHLLLTDVVMPKMSGPHVAEKVSALRPGVKVLYMSGYTDDAILHHGALGTDIPFIQKPFSPLALRKKIREVLGGKPD
jgi:PAS domain S-box-containing protein